LGVEDLEEVDQAAELEVVGEIEGLAARGDGFLERLASFALAGDGGECVLDFLEGTEDGQAVAVEGLFLLGVLHADRGAELAAVEDRREEARTDRPEVAPAAAEGAELLALQAERRLDRQPRIEVRRRLVGQGRGLREIALGAADVRTAAQEVRGKAGGELGD